MYIICVGATLAVARREDGCEALIYGRSKPLPYIGWVGRFAVAVETVRGVRMRDVEGAIPYGGLGGLDR